MEKRKTMSKKYAVVDSRINPDSKKTLCSTGYSLIEIQPLKKMDPAISAHPDMSICKIDDLMFVDDEVNNLFTFFERKSIKREYPKNEFLKYPHDIAFNCAVLGKNLICNKKYTSCEIIAFAESNGYNIIDVKQGYAKCSTCIVAENAIITEDSGIAKQCSLNGIEVLCINKGYVKLEGYNYGFIGGCSGLIDASTLAFNGRIDLHPDFIKIKEFCKKFGVETVSLNNEPLCDAGSIIVI